MSVAAQRKGKSEVAHSKGVRLHFTGSLGTTDQHK